MARVQHFRNGSLGRLGLVYFLIFASYGSTSTYKALYFLRVGLSTAQIGLLLGLDPLITLVSGPAWSMVADRLGVGSRLLTIILGLLVLPTFVMMFTSDFYVLLVLVAVQALLRGPITPLLDSAALREVGRGGHHYGVIRSMGSLGYAPVAWVVGVLVERSRIEWIFVVGAILTLLSCIASARMRTEPAALRRDIAAGLGTIIRRKRWRVMMVTFFVALMIQGAAYGFAPLYLDALGASESTVGFAQALGSASQILVLTLVVPRALARWKSERLLLLSLICFALRVGLWAVAPSVTVVILTHLLTGVTWGTVLLAGVEFAARHAPPGLETTSQALTTTFVFGLGRSAGNAVAGLLYDDIGPQPTFALFSAIAAAAALVFGVTNHRLPVEENASVPSRVEACAGPD